MNTSKEETRLGPGGCAAGLFLYRVWTGDAVRRVALGLAALTMGFLFVGCGAQGDETTQDPTGTRTKDYGSIQDREFAQADQYYDYGDFDRVKVIHLPDGTECVLYHVGNGDSDDNGGGVSCNFPVPTDSATP